MSVFHNSWEYIRIEFYFLVESSFFLYPQNFVICNLFYLHLGKYFYEKLLDLWTNGVLGLLIWDGQSYG